MIGSSDVLSSVARETEPNWDADIRDDVYEECAKFGGVIHIYVDKLSQVCGVCVGVGGWGRGASVIHSGVCYCHLSSSSRVMYMSSVLLHRLQQMLRMH